MTSALGAEIKCANLTAVDTNTLEEIHRAWLMYQVIYFRKQTLTPQEHLAFAKLWGQIHIHPFNAPMKGHPEILQLLKKEGAEHNNGNLWHSDQMYTPEPAKATILIAREMPKFGGDTLFTNQYMAYTTLSNGMKNLLAGLKGVNDGNNRKNFRGKTRSELQQLGQATTPQKTPDKYTQTVTVHPLIRTHPETGQKSLYIGAHTVRFDGMTEAESAPLLNYLMLHSTKPEFCCRLRWEVGTLTMWDNRCCQHYALNDYQGSRRCVHKITVKGDKPF